jgi:mRNA-degrading endonuclease toxin of MazEF toxin-antitoxin module
VTITAPRPGEVIRYAYLWRAEHEAGQEEGVKDRPCAVVMSIAGRADSARVIVLPITHTPPARGANAVELPPAVKRRLGLDDDRSWVVLDEANRFTWPGPDIRPFDGRSGRTVSYGFLPPELFRVVRDRFLALAGAGDATPVDRTE